MSKNTKSATPKSEATPPKSEPVKGQPTAGLVIARKITLKPLQKLGFESRARVGGRVVKTETVTTQYGDSTRFVGDIALKVSESGKWDDAQITRAGCAFLPKAAESVIAAALASHLNDETFEGVEFAFEISKLPADNKVGYEWQVVSLLAPVAAEDKVLLLLG
jgi:hypothetical protein